MKLSLPPMVAAVFLLGVVSSCGGPVRSGTSASRPSHDASSTAPGRDADNDEDGPLGSRYDADDAEILRYGHPAAPSDRHEVEALVERYLAAAVAGDGAAACRLVYRPVVETIVEEAGESSGRASPGAGCTDVMSRLFAREHRDLTANARLAVMGVRVEGRRGDALLDDGGQMEGTLFVHRQAGGWRLESVVVNGLP